eukprot:2859607-Pyramimonas_sp.AAC.1
MSDRGQTDNTVDLNAVYGRIAVALFWVVRELAQEVSKREGQICLEWPTPCRYWHDPRIKELLIKHNMTKMQLHGCAYGLKNRKGQHMKKPWSVAPSLCCTAK